MTIARIPQRVLLLPAFTVLLLLLSATHAGAQVTATKSCSPTGTANEYTCTFTITPGVATTPGAWLVQMVPGPGTFTGTQTVASATGCTNLPTVTPGTAVTGPSDLADYDVTVGGGGCNATAVVVITETVTVTASGSLCQKVWVTTGSPAVTACDTVVFTAPASAPSAAKACVPAAAPNEYTCTFTVTPGFPAAPFDVLHINEPPGPPMTGPGTFTTAPTVSSVSGCAEVPSPVVLSSSTSYNATIGASGCAGGTWSVTFTETIAVTASGQLCQSFYMVASVPPETSCATVVFTPTPTGPSAVKVCTATSTANEYACTFTVTPGVAAAAGDVWPIAMSGSATLTGAPTVSSATGCTNLPTVQVVSVPVTSTIMSTYQATIGAGGCGATAVVVFNETITVTASGQVCQTVWINAGSPGVTSCATCTFTCPCAAVPTAAGITGAIPSTGGFGLIVFGGGTVDQLVAASGCPVTSVGLWTTAGGRFAAYVPGAPAFVNAAFLVSFPGGSIPANTPFILKCV